MNVIELVVAEHEATKVLQTFFQSLDARDYERVSALMSQSGVWHRQGQELVGPSMVREALAQRNPKLKTQHTITNVLPNAQGADAVDIVCYLSVFSDSSGELPAPLGLPGQLAIYQASLAREANSWRITKLSSRITFKR